MKNWKCMHGSCCASTEIGNLNILSEIEENENEHA
jgi:hypothetical protein